VAPSPQALPQNRENILPLSSAMLHGKRSLLSVLFVVFIISQYSFFIILLLVIQLKLAGVLVFSAIPFTAVKAIANSPLGGSLQRKMEETKKSAIQNSSKFKAEANKARKERYRYYYLVSSILFLKYVSKYAH
jgi:hypothetical protein